MFLFKKTRLCFTSTLPCKDNLENHIISKKLRVKRVWNKKAENILSLIVQSQIKSLKKAAKPSMSMVLRRDNIKQRQPLLSKNLRQLKLEKEGKTTFHFARLTRRDIRVFRKSLERLINLRCFDYQMEKKFTTLQSIKKLRHLEYLNLDMEESEILKCPRIFCHFMALKSLSLTLPNHPDFNTQEGYERFLKVLNNLSFLKTLRAIHLSTRKMAFYNASQILETILHTIQSLELTSFYLDFYLDQFSEADIKAVLPKIDCFGLLNHSAYLQGSEISCVELLKTINKKTILFYFYDDPSFGIQSVLNSGPSLTSLLLDVNLLDGVPGNFKFNQNLQHLSLMYKNDSERSHFLQRLKCFMSEIDSLQTFALHLILNEENVVEFEDLRKLSCFENVKNFYYFIRDPGNSNLQVLTDLLEQIGHFSSLEKMHFGTSITNAELESSLEKFLNNFPKLQSLVISFYLQMFFGGNKENFLELPLEAMPELTELNLSLLSYLPAESGKTFSNKILQLKNLKKLNISGKYLDRVDSSTTAKMAQQIFSRPGLEGSFLNYEKIGRDHYMIKKQSFPSLF